MSMSQSRNGADIDESLFGNTMPRGQRTKGNRTNLLIVGKDTVQVVRPKRDANAPTGGMQAPAVIGASELNKLRET